MPKPPKQNAGSPPKETATVGVQPGYPPPRVRRPRPRLTSKNERR